METRSNSRNKITMKLHCKIPEDAGQGVKLACGNAFDADALDISRGGVGFSSKYLLPKGVMLELEIEGTLFGLQQPLKLKGEVVHCKFIKDAGYKCGFKFMDTPEDSQKAIDKFIADNEKRQDPRLELK